VQRLIDTHCHLDSENVEGSVDDAIVRAQSAGVCAFVVIGVGSVDISREAVVLAERRPDVVATAGIHPHDASNADNTSIATLEALLQHDKVVAVGEVGLDYHYDHSPRDIQRTVFARFIDIARRLRKPLVIHTREAPGETLDILAAEGARDVGGVIHCFSEDRAFAARALDLGFDLSFSGIVTFKSARAVQDVAAWAPEGRILLETDSPYLAPVPKRGKKNEPAFIVHTATYVAALRGVSVEHLTRVTTDNAFRRFGRSLAAVARSGRDR
jgi:TatD DNase family protein